MQSGAVMRTKSARRFSGQKQGSKNTWGGSLATAVYDIQFNDISD